MLFSFENRSTGCVAMATNAAVSQRVARPTKPNKGRFKVFCPRLAKHQIVKIFNITNRFLALSALRFPCLANEKWLLQQVENQRRWMIFMHLYLFIETPRILCISIMHKDIYLGSKNPKNTCFIFENEISGAAHWFSFGPNIGEGSRNLFIFIIEKLVFIGSKHPQYIQFDSENKIAAAGS